MKVKERMTEKVITVDLECSLTEAFFLLKENNIRRLPVMDKSHLVGIITLSDLNKAAPSTATSLSMHEINYLLMKTKINDILPKKQKVISISPDNYIETAAKLMRQNRISGLPVISENGTLAGIVTETDIFDALIDILGVKRTHSRIDFYTSERQGALAEIVGMIAAKGKNILNTVAYYDEKKGLYKLIFRLEELEVDDVLQELDMRGYEVESVIVRQENEIIR
ncbi:cbs domain protein [hydrocarbon metagenome]|uniref:Cbs domain protein n=1 Tax=hydrocarbon metagenome TaxID=938273 RepID=A0A0W8E872_9ZZZZ